MNLRKMREKLGLSRAGVIKAIQDYMEDNEPLISDSSIEFWEAGKHLNGAGYRAYIYFLKKLVDTSQPLGYKQRKKGTKHG